MKHATLLAQISLLAACLLPLSNSNAITNAYPVSISLQQAVDKNCNGNVQDKQLAIPGACILYTITATNLGDTPVFNIRLSGKIPKHTRLYSPLREKTGASSDRSLQETTLSLALVGHLIPTQEISLLFVIFPPESCPKNWMSADLAFYGQVRKKI